MLNDHARHILEVKALVDTQPAGKRIELYRWLADLAGDQWTTRQLLQLAEELEFAEQHSEMFNVELKLHFGSPTKSKLSGHPPHDGDGYHDGGGK